MSTRFVWKTLNFKKKKYNNLCLCTPPKYTLFSVWHEFLLLLRVIVLRHDLSTNYFMELNNFTWSVQSSWFMFHNTSFWKFDIFIISVWPAKSAIVYFYLYFCFIFFIHICPQKIVNNFYTITKNNGKFENWTECW